VFGTIVAMERPIAKEVCPPGLRVGGIAFVFCFIVADGCQIGQCNVNGRLDGMAVAGLQVI
jgi:hypothetical protein